MGPEHRQRDLPLIGGAVTFSLSQEARRIRVGGNMGGWKYRWDYFSLVVGN